LWCDIKSKYANLDHVHTSPKNTKHSALPALVTSTFVQIINMPIIRATITMQNPAYVLFGFEIESVDWIGSVVGFIGLTRFGWLIG
jgi:hypothetical protein